MEAARGLLGGEHSPSSLSSAKAPETPPAAAIDLDVAIDGKGSIRSPARGVSGAAKRRRTEPSTAGRIDQPAKEVAGPDGKVKVDRMVDTLADITDHPKVCRNRSVARHRAPSATSHPPPRRE